MKAKRAAACVLALSLMLAGCGASRERMAPETVLASVYGQDVTWEQVEPAYNRIAFQLGGQYDMRKQEMVTMVESMAMDQTITDIVVKNNARNLDLAPITEEENDRAEGQAREEWNIALEAYVKNNNPDIMKMPADSKRDEAYQKAWDEAVQYYEENGWTQESLAEVRRQSLFYDRVRQSLGSDLEVTPDEVEQEYRVQASKQKKMIEEHPDTYIAYCGYAQTEEMYCRQTGEQQLLPPVGYRPEGYRRVKVLMIPCSDEVMGPYITEKYQYEGLETYELTGKEDPELAEYIEQAQTLLEQACIKRYSGWLVPGDTSAEKLTETENAVLESVQDIVNEVQQNVADGAEFDDYIAKYGVNSDGTYTDPAEQELPVMVEGHAVCADTARYLPEFAEMVDTAMEPQIKGAVSDPVVTPFGVVLFQYLGEAPRGPVSISQKQREVYRDILLKQKQDDRFRQTVDGWLEEAGITYTGEIPSQAQLREQYGA